MDFRLCCSQTFLINSHETVYLPSLPRCVSWFEYNAIRERVLDNNTEAFLDLVTGKYNPNFNIFYTKLII